jgi:hypothetical protein
MPAIPVLQKDRPQRIDAEVASALADFEPRIYERGDKIILLSKVQRFTPQASEIEEYAFSQAVKKNAPNENLVWLKGQYVEADNPNANGAMWSAQELSIKSLTPMLMPVTVMHDPRTAVGTIADVKMLTPERDKVKRARIDTVLALWGHRFPEAVDEALANAEAGTLMQSMECFSPWYACSECSQVFHKLPHGAEQAMWCSHLKASRPSGGSPDFMPLGTRDQDANASRILGDVTFTGTGLIFGSRGARGAYSEAYLENFGDELAMFHQSVHHNTASAEPTPRRTAGMSLVQIEDSELANLRKERDDAKTEATAAKQAQQEAERKVEETEAAKVKAEEEKAEAVKERDTLKESVAQAELKEKRWGALGSGFVAKLGDTTKANLQRDASKLDDTAWDTRLAEVEELAGVKRDAKAEGGEGGSGSGGGGGEGGGGDSQARDTFTLEQIAQAQGLTAGGQPQPVGDAERRSVVGSLAGAFKK